MARKETIPAAHDTGAALIDTDQLNEDMQLIEQRETELAVIDADYADNLPYDATRIENEVRFYLAQSAEAMLAAGNRLILLKEHEQHGAFLECLERIGLKPRTAQNFMKAAAKLRGSNTQTLAYLGKSKVFELISEEDEELEKLIDGGTLAGHTLDDIDKMSTRELKHALRAAKEEKQASEKIIEQKDKKINELDREAQRRELLAGDALHNELEKDLTEALGATLGQLHGLNKAIEIISDWGTQVPEHLHGACHQALERIRSRLRDIELNNNVVAIDSDAEDFNDEGIPVWATDIPRKGDAA